MRRAKESLLVIAVGALFTFCALSVYVPAAPQSAKAEQPPGGARNSKGGQKGSGGKAGNKANTSTAANVNKSEASSTPPPAETPPGAEAGAQTAATPQGSPPVVQTTPVAKADEAGRPAGETNFAAAARRLFDQWGLVAAVVAIALGLIALVVYTVKLRRRFTVLGGELDAVKDHLRGSGETFMPGQTVAWTGRAPAGGGTGRGAAADKPPPEGDGQEPTPETEPAGILTDAINALKDRVEKIEERLASDEKAQTDSQAEAEAEDLDEGEASHVVRPPQKVTVAKMVEWAESAGLRLESVKATFGLFGNFSQSADGDNWLAISDGDSYLFPRVKRFESDSHFKSDYFDYYDCEHPSAGTVVVDQPATVSSDPQGGWKLVDKGKLSVVAP